MKMMMQTIRRTSDHMLVPSRAAAQSKEGMTEGNSFRSNVEQDSFHYYVRLRGESVPSSLYTLDRLESKLYKTASPRHPRRGRKNGKSNKKSVRFDRYGVSNDPCTAERACDYYYVDTSDDEVTPSELWYTKKEFRKLQENEVRITKHLSQSLENNHFARDGVESIEYRRHKKSRMRDALIITLLEQEMCWTEQRDLSHRSAEEHIANAYSSVARTAAILALQRAKVNAEQIKKFYAVENLLVSHR
jgi:hypothetical protein